MNNRGAVLIVALWVLIILALIAWGLGRRAALEVSLVDTYRGKLRSLAAARSGLNQVLDLLQKAPAAKDCLYSDGILISATQSPETLFSHVDTGPRNYAIIAWPAAHFNGVDDGQMQYGIRDEGGRININAIGISNYQVLSALLQVYGLSLAEGDRLALAIVNYTGLNAQASNNQSFKNLDDALLKTKNRPYENLLELLEVNGMTKEIFAKIKDDVTVYGDIQNGLRVNVDTADNDVIQAVVHAAARVNPSVNADEVISQAYALRDGADSRSFTLDDGAGSLASVADPNWPAALQEGVSNYYRARVIGIDAVSGARSIIEAVIHRVPGAPAVLVSRQRD